MKKIANYILNGQGLGIKFLMGLSVLMALLFAIIVRVKGADLVPYAQEIADQMLPIKIENGVVVQPANTFKMARIEVEGYAIPVEVPLVLDTRVDSLDTNNLPQGVYMTRTKIYTINNNQVKMMQLEGDTEIVRADYTNDFKSWLNWIAIISGICAVVGIFVFYLLLALFYSVCTQFIAWIASKNMTFDRRMRLSSLALTAGYIIFVPLEMIGVRSTLLFFALMIVALSLFVVKKAPSVTKTKTIAPSDKVENEVAAPQTENVKTVSEAKPTAPKKALVKKVAAKKTQTKKPTAEKKTEAKTSAKKAPEKKPIAKKTTAVKSASK